MDSGEFDPRFDPAFQPGFDPEKHRPGPRRLFGFDASAVHESTDASASLPHPRMVADAANQGSGRPGQPQAGPHDVAHAPAESKIWDDRPVPLRGNPYVRALWLVSAGLVVGGFLLYWWANSGDDAYTWDKRPPFLLVLQQSSWVLVPAMFTVGLAGIVGLLFLYAGRWRPGALVEDEHVDGGLHAGQHRTHDNSSTEQSRPPEAGGGWL